MTDASRDRLNVGTVNILNLADRWPERLPLVVADMATLRPDDPSDHLGISARLEIG